MTIKYFNVKSQHSAQFCEWLRWYVTPNFYIIDHSSNETLRVFRDSLNFLPNLKKRSIYTVINRL